MTSMRSFSIGYLVRLLRFCLRRHPVIIANLSLALFSVLIELVAMASLMPLSLIAAGEQIATGSKWSRLFEFFGTKPSFASAITFFVVAFSLRLLTQFLNQSTSVFVGKRVQADLSAQAFSHIVQDMNLREIDSKSAGHFISLAGDETARAGMVVVVVNQLLAAAFLAIAYFFAIVYFSWLLGLAVVIFLVVVMACLGGTLRKSQALSARQLEESKTAHSIFLDALNGLRSVRALSAESFVTSQYHEIIHRYTMTHFFIEMLAFSAKLVPALILLLVVMGVALAGYFNVGSAPGLAMLVTSLAFLLRFFPAAGMVLSSSMRLLTDLRAASDVTHLLDAPAKTIRNLRHRPLEGRVETMELRGVWFRYAPSRPLIQDFSVSLQRGRSYALVGPSGSGKTTLFDLLLGFYTPDGGAVLINGIPVPDLDSREIRSHIVLIGQQVSILNDTASNNVRFGAQASEQQVKAACSVACIDTYIEGLAQKYDTLFSFQGANLSGGQRQRIGIARGLLRNPDVLLLDESTTGLDADTRNTVVKNILGSYRDKIVVFSTHDESIINQVDVVIDIGNVSNQQGST
jgi:ABC-type bacteriocin/lantibiotic exporter with double-glycine peptidase domain